MAKNKRTNNDLQNIT